MANNAAKRSILRKRKQEKEDRANYKKCLFKVYKPHSEEPATFTILHPESWSLLLYVHEWDGMNSMRVPAICKSKQYGEKKCRYCSTTGKYGPNYPTLYKVYIAFLHNYVGKIYKDERTKKKIPYNPLRLIMIKEGKDTDNNWAKIDEYAGDKKKFMSLVFQLKSKEAIRVLKDALKAKFSTKGIVPKDAWAVVKPFSEDEVQAHILNGFVEDTVDFDYFNVEEIVVEGDDDKKSDSKSSSSKPKTKSKSKDDDDEDEDDDDDDDDDSDDEEDEDDEEPVKKRASKSAASKKSTKSSKKKSKDDDEEEEDEDEDEDDDEPAPKRKSKSKTSNKKPVKKAHWSSKDDDDEEEDDDEEDDEDDADEEDEDDEEDETPKKAARKKKPAPKSKSKSVLKSKSKSKPADDDDEDEDDEDDEDDDED